ncbi:DgyrCDS5364 [Dimorphilus gyrociliatus]|uniref:Palmitoyltransferase n=1 Tax=Dimorphilus gyrociliatus TaxID=2664684 RepID=A0A7I8VKC9_9ANNE|nr:DgyrCDS5364 [Dimorphilus gyrociliatus]
MYGKISAKDPLCCCEYVDKNSERSHVLASCCDCEALDSSCDHCIRCKPIPQKTLNDMIDTIGDRCRLPMCFGKGAIQIRLDTAIPVLLVPSSILLATLGPYFTAFSFCTLPLMIYFFYRVLTRDKLIRTDIFYTFGLTSVFLMFYTFEFVVIGYREILLWENIVVVILFSLLLICLIRARKDPGVLQKSSKKSNESYLKNHVAESHPVAHILKNSFAVSDEDITDCITDRASTKSLDSDQVNWADSRGFINGKLNTWCSQCDLRRIPRSGHCPICRICVRIRCHHCLWIDRCVGNNNHRFFFFGLLLSVLLGYYGSHLTLTTICTPKMYYDWFLIPDDCRYLYADLPTALCFVSAIYTIIFTTFLSFILLQQILLISQNATSQELHQASIRGYTTCILFIRKKNNPNDRGLFWNWINFLGGNRKERYGHYDI